MKVPYGVDKESAFLFPCGIYATEMLVTPELAQHWLDNDNTCNRPKSPASEKVISTSIDYKEFAITHQGIAFGSSGQLYDGQTRLGAVVRSGLSLRTMVFFNLKPNVQEVLDTGRKRSFSNHLSMKKFPYASTVASAVTIIQSLEIASIKEKTTALRGIAHGMEVLQRHPQLAGHAAYAHKFKTDRGIWTAMSYVGDSVDTAATKELFDAVQAEDARPGTWAKWLLDVLYPRQSGNESAFSITSGTKVAYIIQALEASMNGVKLGKKGLQPWDRSKDFPVLSGDSIYGSLK